jgi:mono/diheme cytochrome c family protein
MREKLARRIALLTALMILGLAWLFADLQNPGVATAASPSSAAPSKAASGTLPAASASAGAEVFVQAGCARCHSVAGKGSRRSPLDGVGARLSQAEIRRWITPNKAEPDAFIASHADLTLSDQQREALLAYLMGLRN